MTTEASTETFTTELGEAVFGLTPEQSIRLQVFQALAGLAAAGQYGNPPGPMAADVLYLAKAIETGEAK